MTAITSSPGSVKGTTRIIVASTVGTLFEWYDFFLYGTLANVISEQFFSSLNVQSKYIFALLAFGVGFAFRPLGALIFGRLGDMMGRKYTFLFTLLLMGGATFCVGLLPNYASWGAWSPSILILLRIIQGIGIGGEYGGAAVFVAEHAPARRRGEHTSWIQTTGAMGMVFSLVVVYVTREITGNSFASWGWRLPFLFSGILLPVCLYLRMSISESPLFLQMKAEGTTSKAPIRETLGNWANLKIVLIALFGLVTGTTVVIYTGQVYSFFFLAHTLRVESGIAGLYVAMALVLSMPLFWFFGMLSDRVGRRPVILLGCLLGALTYFPIFHGLTHYANPALEYAINRSPVKIIGDSSSCSLQFDVIRTREVLSLCDKTKTLLASGGVPYSFDRVAGSETMVAIGDTFFKATDSSNIRKGLAAAGYPDRADPLRINGVMVVLLIWLMSVYLAMVFAPLAALLVEMFPPKIRLTALSLPYHLGNGIFGGFFPTIAFAIVAQTGDIYAGLWYPIIFSLLTVIVGFVFLREKVILGSDFNDDLRETGSVSSLEGQKSTVH
ncbi:MFS transporter [Caballeronia sp. M23-90]